MTKSVILKNLMNLLLISAIILLAIRTFHRFVMRSVENYDYTAQLSKELPPTDYHDYRGYIGHTDFKRRSKV